jgi:hypothetical protein
MTVQLLLVIYPRVGLTSWGPLLLRSGISEELVLVVLIPAYGRDWSGSVGLWRM